MKLNPYLSFDGDCESAFTFYQEVLGGNIGEKMTWADCPEGNEIPSGWEHKIMHMQMSMGDYQIMGADIHPDYFEASKGISLSINVEDPAQAERIFAALSENGTVKISIGLIKGCCGNPIQRKQIQVIARIEGDKNHQ